MAETGAGDMNLPQSIPWPVANQRWASILNPVIANPITQGNLLKDVSLSNGTTIVNHKLGKDLSGWFVVGINGVATIYDNQASNQTPNLTLSLTSNAAVIVNLWVF